MTALELFAGRTDAIGTEEGGALRRSPQHRRRTAAQPRSTWWSDYVSGHFDGTGDPVGVYPMVHASMLDGPDCYQPRDEWVVKWGCIDYDEGDEASLVHANNTARVLDMAAGITGYIEKSRSKGYHVWVFADAWIPALVMRRALLAAAQVVNAPMKEINPKQVTLPRVEGKDDYKLGNYVRLPYPGGNEQPEGRRMVWANVPTWDYIGLAEFVQDATETRCTVEQLQQMGTKYVEPVKRQRKTVPSDIDMNTPWRDRLDGFTHTLLYGHGNVPGGPYEGQDRSSWLWKLCNSLIERTPLTDEEILAALLLGHDTYTPDKFGHRAEEELDRMMTKAMEQHDNS